MGLDSPVRVVVISNDSVRDPEIQPHNEHYQYPDPVIDDRRWETQETDLKFFGKFEGKVFDFYGIDIYPTGHYYLKLGTTILKAVRSVWVQGIPGGAHDDEEPYLNDEFHHLESIRVPPTGIRFRDNVIGRVKVERPSYHTPEEAGNLGVCDRVDISIWTNGFQLRDVDNGDVLLTVATLWITCREGYKYRDSSFLFETHDRVYDQSLSSQIEGELSGLSDLLVESKWYKNLRIL